MFIKFMVSFGQKSGQKVGIWSEKVGIWSEIVKNNAKKLSFGQKLLGKSPVFSKKWAWLKPNKDKAFGHIVVRNPLIFII